MHEEEEKEKVEGPTATAGALSGKTTCADSFFNFTFWWIDPGDLNIYARISRGGGGGRSFKTGSCNCRSNFRGNENRKLRYFGHRASNS